jgi:hypothetical protein
MHTVGGIIKKISVIVSMFLCYYCVNAYVKLCIVLLYMFMHELYVVFLA